MGARQMLKQKTCKSCRQKFTPTRPMQSACSPACAIAIAERKREKQAQQMAAEKRRETRQQLESMKGIPELIREADKAFCAFVRARDAGKPCICCGRSSSGWSRGGDWDAGHYRSRGAASHLRYHEDNCHSQLKQCNRRAFDVASYRRNLIERIGIARVEALENDNGTHKWTRDELKMIKAEYIRKRKEIEACQTQ